MKNSINHILVIAVLTTLFSCGTRELRPDEYIEVGRGEKALLITKNTEALNPFDWLFESMFGEPDSEKNVTINKIDGKKIKFNIIINENQHVLVEPGLRVVELSCFILYKDKNKERANGDTSIKMEFKGGFKYETRIASIRYNKCSSKIKPDERYNKSLK